MDLTPKDDLVSTPELGRRLRQLRWFRRAFQLNVQAVTEHFGIAFAVDEGRLNQVFFDWIDSLARQPRLGGQDRADYFVFAAGLALREFIQRQPARVSGPAQPLGPADQTTRHIAAFWPEGFLYTNFCVCSLAAVHEQEFGRPLDLAKAASDLRTWWSFRENAEQDPANAIAFFDQFVGAEPNWLFPAQLLQRAAVRQLLSSAPSPSSKPVDLAV